MIRKISYAVSILAILSALIVGCSSTPTPGPGTGTGTAVPTSTQQATTELPVSQFSADNFLFVEVRERRVRKSETGDQTTSFTGEQSTYSFDPEDGTLSGPLDGTLTSDEAVVVGHLVITQIDQNTATSGRLYALPEGGQAFGPITIEGVEADGGLIFSHAGEPHVLQRGESVQLELETPAGDDFSAGQMEQTVTITNHGFLPRQGLITR